MGIDSFNPTLCFSDRELERLNTPPDFRDFMGRRILGMNNKKWDMIIARAREVMDRELCKVTRALMETVIEDFQEMREWDV